MTSIHFSLNTLLKIIQLIIVYLCGTDCLHKYAVTVVQRNQRPRHTPGQSGINYGELLKNRLYLLSFTYPGAGYRDSGLRRYSQISLSPDYSSSSAGGSPRLSQPRDIVPQGCSGWSVEFPLGGKSLEVSRGPISKRVWTLFYSVVPHGAWWRAWLSLIVSQSSAIL